MAIKFLKQQRLRDRVIIICRTVCLLLLVAAIAVNHFHSASRDMSQAGVGEYGYYTT